MVVDRYGKESFRVVLSDYILVDEFLDFYRLGQFLLIEFGSSGAFLALTQSFLSNLISLGSATVADVTVHSRNQESDFILRPAAEATLFLCS